MHKEQIVTALQSVVKHFYTIANTYLHKHKEDLLMGCLSLIDHIKDMGELPDQFHLMIRDNGTQFWISGDEASFKRSAFYHMGRQEPQAYVIPFTRMGGDGDTWYAIHCAMRAEHYFQEGFYMDSFIAYGGDAYKDVTAAIDDLLTTEREAFKVG